MRSRTRTGGTRRTRQRAAELTQGEPGATALDRTVVTAGGLAEAKRDELAKATAVDLAEVTAGDLAAAQALPPRWYRLRVETEHGCAFGRVPVDTSQPVIEQIVQERVPEFRLWQARLETGDESRLLVLERRAIRSIEVMGVEAAPEWGAP